MEGQRIVRIKMSNEQKKIERILAEIERMKTVPSARLDESEEYVKYLGKYLRFLSKIISNLKGKGIESEEIREGVKHSLFWLIYTHKYLKELQTVSEHMNTPQNKEMALDLDLRIFPIEDEDSQNLFSFLQHQKSSILAGAMDVPKSFIQKYGFPKACIVYFIFSAGLRIIRDSRMIKTFLLDTEQGDLQFWSKTYDFLRSMERQFRKFSESNGISINIDYDEFLIGSRWDELSESASRRGIILSDSVRLRAAMLNSKLIVKWLAHHGGTRVVDILQIGFQENDKLIRPTIVSITSS